MFSERVSGQGELVDQSTLFEVRAAHQVAAANPLIEGPIVAGLGFASFQFLLGALFHPWAAQLPIVGLLRPKPRGASLELL
jgi:hypothetical protein